MKELLPILIVVITSLLIVFAQAKSIKKPWHEMTSREKKAMIALYAVGFILLFMGIVFFVISERRYG